MKLLLKRSVHDLGGEMETTFLNLLLTEVLGLRSK